MPNVEGDSIEHRITKEGIIKHTCLLTSVERRYFDMKACQRSITFLKNVPSAGKQSPLKR